MNNLAYLNDWMAAELSRQILLLERRRLLLFLNWLGRHCTQMKTDLEQDPFSESTLAQCLRTRLRVWLGSLSVPGQLWEFHLILEEIDWWRTLDPTRLAMFLDPAESCCDG